MNRKQDFNNLREWLTKKLDERLMTVEDLARESRISRTLLYDWMNDKWRPTHNTMPKVVRALSDTPVIVTVNGKTTQELRPISLEEAYAQYTQRTLGRPKGSGGEVRAVPVRN
jgi:transcriptional regulator with XRE-family HTH domain